MMILSPTLPPPYFLSPFFKTFVTHPPKINELDTVVTPPLSPTLTTPKIWNVHQGGVGGGWGCGCNPQQVYPIFLSNGKSFLQTKLFPVGSYLGHLSMKKFSDRTYCLGSKVRQREGAVGRGGGGFSNHKDDIQSRQIFS